MRYLIKIFCQFQHTTLQIVAVSFWDFLQVYSQCLWVDLKAQLFFSILAELGWHVCLLCKIVQELSSLQIYHTSLNNFPNTSGIFRFFIDRLGISLDVIDVLLGYCSDLYSVLKLCLELLNYRHVVLYLSNRTIWLPVWGTPSAIDVVLWLKKFRISSQD